MVLEYTLLLTYHKIILTLSLSDTLLFVNNKGGIMKAIRFSQKSLLSSLRFLAHLFSVLLIFVVVLLVLGESFPRLSNATVNELLLTLSLLVLLIGLFAAWKWEGIGGTLIILGFLLFFILNSASSDQLKLGIFFLLFPLTGLLYLFCCWKERKPKGF